MQVELLPSAPGDSPLTHYLTSFVVGGTVAVDAGCLGIARLEIQSRVRHVFLTHSHADHVGSLPVFLENVHAAGPEPVTVHGHPHTLDALRRDVFNGRLWPDLVRLSETGPPFLRLRPLEAGETVAVNGMRVRPVPVDHTVPCYGYVVDDGTSAVAFGGDSGPTEAIWKTAAGTGRLRGAFLEASFPDAMEDLAKLTGHLTPGLLGEEVAKLPEGTRVVAVHIKARYRDRIVRELEGLGIPGLAPGVSGRHRF